MQRSVVLTGEELALLERRARELGWSIEEREGYEAFVARLGTSRLIAYSTGSVVYSGDEAEALVCGVLTSPPFDAVVGSDEAGKGEWYGPLVVVALGASPAQLLEMRMMGIRDSKFLTRERLERLGSALERIDVPKGVMILSPQRYNELYERLSSEGRGLNDLLAWAHASTIADVLTRLEHMGARRVRITVDEFDAPKLASKLKVPEGLECTLVQRHGAEAEPEVAAASILAKYIFEKEVTRLEHTHGVRLRKGSPARIFRDVLPMVAKLHFKGVG